MEKLVVHHYQLFIVGLGQSLIFLLLFVLFSLSLSLFKHFNYVQFIFPISRPTRRRNTLTLAYTHTNTQRRLLIPNLLENLVFTPKENIYFYISNHDIHNNNNYYYYKNYIYIRWQNISSTYENLVFIPQNHLIPTSQKRKKERKKERVLERVARV